jgi:chloramphenicol 3-O phosphotransferase
MSRGTIIFLNGTSSAGKTTLAHALQERLPEAYQHMALDQFRDGLPAKFRGLNAPCDSMGQRGLNVVPVISDNGDMYTEVRFGEDGKRLLGAMRRAIATMAGEGINIIIDDILLEQEFLVDYLDVMSDQTLYLVGVRCPREVIAERESARPGRFPGTAEGHFVTCHAHQIYDVEVDTSRLSPNECAAIVADRLEAGPPEAFNQLKQVIP